MVDMEMVRQATEILLKALGEDSGRPGLAETPARVARMYTEILAGNDDDAGRHLDKTFDVDNNNMIIEKDISFFSTCEHHLLPFFGKIHIAYIPDGKTVGLSKLSRAVEVYARRLQLQERMNGQIADAVMAHLKPLGVMVIVEAEHTCMTMRGIKKVGNKVISYVCRGSFEKDRTLQAMVMNNCFR